MKYRSPFWLMSALVATLAGALNQAQAQERGRIRINTIRVGFPSSLVDSQFKAGNWSPVYVDVTAGPAPVTRAKLTIESVDTDDVRNNYTVDVPALEPGESATLMAYTKPGSAGDEITAVIRIDDVVAANKSDLAAAIGLDHHLYLTVGGRIPGIRRALAGEVGQPAADGPPAYTGPEHVASLDDIRQFPNRWFGYEGVDLMIFTTSDRDFLTAFLNEREGHKEALADWVRRGGRLIVTVGRNQDLVGQIDILQNLMPVTVKGLQQLPLLRGPAHWADPRHGGGRKSAPQGQRQWKATTG